MNKKIIIGLVSALAIIGGTAHAQSIDTSTMTDSDLRTLLAALIQELGLLEQQLATQLQNQSSTPAVTPNLGTVSQPQTQPFFNPIITMNSTTPTVEKTITLFQDGIRIFAIYEEDGTPIPNVALTLSADDDGRISDSSVASKWTNSNDTELTHDVTVFNRPDFTIGAVFEYVPDATGTRTLTVEGNGVSQTIQIQN